MQISVICPVYNTRPALIEAAVASVLSQAKSDILEVILVDDASSNVETLNILDAMREQPNIQVVRSDRNLGPARARNLGIAQAEHPWIGFVDADDLWTNDKLMQAHSVLHDFPDTRWIGGNYATLGADDVIRPYTPITKKISGDQSVSSQRLGGEKLASVLVFDWMPLGASLIKKEAILATGGFESDLRYGEDWLLCLLLSTRCPMDYCKGETYILRRQESSMMRSPGRLSRQFLQASQRARRDPRLATIRKQLRWKNYSEYKDVAMNNAINNRKLIGLYFAFRAFLIDPREIGELSYFGRAMLCDKNYISNFLRKYSSAEQIVLDNALAHRL